MPDGSRPPRQYDGVFRYFPVWFGMVSRFLNKLLYCFHQGTSKMSTQSPLVHSCSRNIVMKNPQRFALQSYFSSKSTGAQFAQFVHDTTLIARYAASLACFLHNIDILGNISGPKANHNKTKQYG